METHVHRIKELISRINFKEEREDKMENLRLKDMVRYQSI